MNFGENFLTYPDLFPARPSGEPWGDERVMIGLAGDIYVYEGLSTVQADAVRQRFGKLCLPLVEASPMSVRIQIFRAAADDFVENREHSRVAYNQSHTPDAVKFIGRRFMCRLDWMPELRTALWVPEIDLQYQLAIFVQFLQTTIAYRVFEQGGLLFHSAAVVSDGGADIFFGPSGAGKSTISRLSFAMGHAVLNDDMNILRFTEAGIMVEKLPFTGFLGQEGGGMAGIYPVRAMYRLYKGPTPVLHVLQPATALVTLLGCVHYVSCDPYRWDRLIDRLQKLSTMVPIQALTFARDDRFWALLRSGETE
ncbi:MAG: hypothetical protein RKO25_02845 [Candidatus Contendobacter sp.]|nr:hypothetical protein [Candidatus Contendobacter sp.]